MRGKLAKYPNSKESQSYQKLVIFVVDPVMIVLVLT